MAEEPELSDIVLRALLARRAMFRGSAARRAITIVGHEHASESLALRTYAARLALIHEWLDADSPTAAALIRAAGLRAADLPAVILPDAVLRRASPGDLAHALGLTVDAGTTAVVDLVVIGGGPGGACGGGLRSV